MPISEGAIIDGRFRPEAPLGRGALFDSFVARDERLGRRVFLKMQRDDLDEAAARLAAAHRPFWTRLAGLPVPGMPATLDLGERDRLVYLVCQWVEGQSLAAIGSGAARPAAEMAQAARRLLEQGLEALAALHEAGLVHGDLSPRNILASARFDRFWLIDPALPAGGPQRLVTPAWAAPEVNAGAPPGPRSDVYSLGRIVSEFGRRHGAWDSPLIATLTDPDPARRPADGRQALDQLLRAESAAAGRGGSSSAWGAFPDAAATGGAAGWGAPPDEASGWGGPPPVQQDWGAVTALQGGAAGGPEVDGWSGITRIGEAGGPAAADMGSAPGNEAIWDSLSREAGFDVDWARGVGTPVPAPDPARPGGGLVQGFEAGADPEGEAWSSRTQIQHVPMPGGPASDPREADFVVMGPTIVARDHSFPLELWIGPSERGEELRERASDRGRLIERGGRSRVEMAAPDIVTAVMTLPGFSVLNPTEQIRWDGTIRNTAFIVEGSRDKPAGRYAGLLKLAVGAIPLGAISFWIEIGDGATVPDLPPAPIGEPMRLFRTAFGSYSRRNLAEVFKRVQAIRAGSIDIFIDIANLRGGERWQDVLLREIGARDIFYLFWSREAAASQWVEREWRIALERRGLDFICPIPLEDPRFAEPPKELADLHFNDWCLSIIRGEERLAE